MLVRLEQEENAELPILSAPCGISNVASIRQFWNIPSLIWFMLLGNVTLLR